MVVGGSFRGFGACLLWSEAVALNGRMIGRSRVSSLGAVFDESCWTLPAVAFHPLFRPMSGTVYSRVRLSRSYVFAAVASELVGPISTPLH